MLPLLLAAALASSSSPAGRVVRPSHVAGAPVAADTLGARSAAHAFLYALYANDTAAFRGMIVPEPGSEVMLGAQRFTAVQLAALRVEMAGARLELAGPPTLDGVPARKADDGHYPLGSKVAFVTQVRGVPMVVPVVRAADGWRVDVRFWLASVRQAQARPDAASPESRARAFLFNVLARHPEALGALSATPIDAGAFTRGNDLPAGDLDQVLSLCDEMPIVRAREGERVRMPSGEVVTASASGEMIVLIGMMGPVEVPFVLRRMSGEWRVVPQRYFEALKAAGGI